MAVVNELDVHAPIVDVSVQAGGCRLNCPIHLSLPSDARCRIEGHSAMEELSARYCGSGVRGGRYE